ncbi:MAG: hypothetical protein KA004_18525 [Verrucomicrobiales bacterium]|nr:hypothetical protein [Verrucomicrobiales bacterium]
MNILDLIDRLKALEKEKRCYFTETSYPKKIQQRLKQATSLTGVQDFSDRLQIIDAVRLNHPGEFIASHFFVYGKSDFTELQAWYDPLPEDFVEFYSHIRAGMLCFENFVWLMPLDEMLANELEMRRIMGPVDPKLRREPPLGFVRFADLGNDLYFALRHFDGSWKVVSSTRDCSDSELEGPEGNDYICDDSFAAWLERMLDTEANPLFPDVLHPEEKDRWTYSKRIG